MRSTLQLHLVHNHSLYFLLKIETIFDDVKVRKSVSYSGLLFLFSVTFFLLQLSRTFNYHNLKYAAIFNGGGDAGGRLD